MAKTRADLINRSLRILKVLPEGQSASAWQSETMGDVVDAEHGALEIEGIAYWETSAIPDAVMTPLAHYIAGKASFEFLAESETANYAARGMDAKRELRALVARAPSGAPARTERL